MMRRDSHSDFVDDLDEDETLDLDAEESIDDENHLTQKTSLVSNRIVLVVLVVAVTVIAAMHYLAQYQTEKAMQDSLQERLSTCLTLGGSWTAPPNESCKIPEPILVPQDTTPYGLEFEENPSLGSSYGTSVDERLQDIQQYVALMR